MSDGLEEFYNSIPNHDGLAASRLIPYFAYFLTEVQGNASFTARAIDDCFSACDLPTPSRTAQVLSEGIKSKPAKFVKTTLGGYRLEATHRKQIAATLGQAAPAKQTSSTLRALLPLLPAVRKQEFLKETIDCFEIGAYRAAIVMCWILTLDHLYDYVLSKKLFEFNAVLSLNKDKSVKTSLIKGKDDFSDVPENKFLDFLREGRIISNDVFKILGQKLGTRNSSAHPSGVVLTQIKAIDFIEDLVRNIIHKYDP